MIFQGLLSSRSLFSSWDPNSQSWAFKTFPNLDPLSAIGVGSLADKLIPICSGPGRDDERCNYLTQILDAQEGRVHQCALVEDNRQHSAAFYASAQQRTDILQRIIQHESNW